MKRRLRSCVTLQHLFFPPQPVSMYRPASQPSSGWQSAVACISLLQVKPAYLYNRIRFCSLAEVSADPCRCHRAELRRGVGGWPALGGGAVQDRRLWHPFLRGGLCDGGHVPAAGNMSAQPRCAELGGSDPGLALLLLHSYACLTHKRLTEAASSLTSRGFDRRTHWNGFISR